jgi:hypothetical protein
MGNHSYQKNSFGFYKFRLDQLFVKVIIYFYSLISLNVTVVSFGIVFCVIVYFFIFLFVMNNLTSD